MARRNCAMSLRRADGRRQKAHLATPITIRRYMRPRYAVLAALVVCGFCYEGAGPAAAQSWPTRPLTMVVPFAPGGGTDVLGADNLQEFIAYAKANQATMQMASAGAGSTGHLDCMLLNAAIGINVTHVPYRGGGLAMQDLIAGRIDHFCTLSATANHPIPCP